MPFTTKMRPYIRGRILTVKPDQNGIYGIFRDDKAIYIGSGDIRDRMTKHIDGDNDCITENTPNKWTAFLVSGDPTKREGELIREYDPICNQVIPS